MFIALRIGNHEFQLELVFAAIKKIPYLPVARTGSGFFNFFEAICPESSTKSQHQRDKVKYPMHSAIRSRFYSARFQSARRTY